jgi:DNA-binding response OmpR family regulator
MKTQNGKYEILIVEDNEELASITKLLLEQNNFKAEFITDSTIAYDKIKKDRPLMVILDLLMPNLDGLRLCRKIKLSRKLNNTKIIIYSGKNYESDRRKAINLGADAFFVKPTRAHLLIEKIKELLQPIPDEAYQN